MVIDPLSFGAGVALSGFTFFVFRALSHPKLPAGKPHLIYFPIAGRGELSRLIAAAGEPPAGEPPPPPQSVALRAALQAVRQRQRSVLAAATGEPRSRRIPKPQALQHHPPRARWIDSWQQPPLSWLVWCQG